LFDAFIAKQPAVPSSQTNPVGQTQRIKRTRSLIAADIRRARDMVLGHVEGWQYTIANEMRANAFYDFFVDTAQLEAIVDAIQRALAGGAGADGVRQAAAGAYREGTARAVDNLAGLSSDYPRKAVQRLADGDVLRRATMAGARAFEQMSGFAAQVAKDLSRVLFDAVQSGENPRQTARIIRDRFKISLARALMIARTEITMAHRRGRWDEARDAEERFGIRTMLLHNSALIAGRTRRTHAARHGGLFTREEEAAWYSTDGNAINCLCSQTEVTVDKNGKPLFGEKLIARMAERRTQFIAAGVEPGST